jgi:hypothetical protein
MNPSVFARFHLFIRVHLWLNSSSNCRFQVEGIVCCDGKGRGTRSAWIFCFGTLLRRRRF